MDFLLLQKMKMGDENAIEIFVHKYYHQIFKYCRLHIGDYGYAEDAALETFERFFRTIDRYKHYGKAVNYLYAIAANCCRDYYRKNMRRPGTSFEQIPEKGDNGMEGLEEWIDIQNMLNRLPDDIKEAAILYFCQEMKQKEIAKILGIGLPLVKYRIKKAKKLLSYYIGREE
ncbi:ECF RNA polymerase sigma factor SigC [Clostridiales bacterium]|nr:ECF RNA polymerase sigma factor SigC [Clostridiales bacterium]